METISARVPDDLEAEIDAYLEDENPDRSTAVRKFLSEGLEEWRRERARTACGRETHVQQSGRTRRDVSLELRRTCQRP